MGVDTLSEASIHVNMSCMERLIAEFETCCQPLMEAPLASGDAEVLAGVMGALADPARLRLLSLLAASPNGECCGCDLTEPLGLSQPTVSHHLKVLHEAGLLDRDRRGRWVYYSLRRDRLAALRTILSPAPTEPTDRTTDVFV
ncbi:MAG: ArsR family transcriptional regulator, arsenate/arsenite/antimonite-responsive transcriptional [Solirubrobacterales bacterium]|nr:ArsR family transcriptional regulator, arsenate/arsenite/antimonite-responsive transcriptional [Solirubrobacterales bacterium]